MSSVELGQRAIQVLRDIAANPHINLGDLIYDVREAEGEGWNGPSVIAWGRAVDEVKAIVRESIE